VDDLAKIERLESELAEVHAALISRGEIGEAKGILMERFSLTANEAWNVLQKLSSRQNVKLREVAADLVRTRVVPAD
jgi:AmiR/NasT family two-component response regulator